MPADSAPVLIYDGECAFCRQWVRRWQRWDRRGRVRLLSLQDPAAVQLSGRSREQLEEAMCLVLPGGIVRVGADVLPDLLTFVSGGTLVRIALGFPGVMWLTHRVYGWVARRRYRLGCGGGHCRVDRSRQEVSFPVREEEP